MTPLRELNGGLRRSITRLEETLTLVRLVGLNALADRLTREAEDLDQIAIALDQLDDDMFHAEVRAVQEGQDEKIKFVNSILNGGKTL